MFLRRAATVADTACLNYKNLPHFFFLLYSLMRIISKYEKNVHPESYRSFLTDIVKIPVGIPPVSYIGYAFENTNNLPYRMSQVGEIRHVRKCLAMRIILGNPNQVSGEVWVPSRYLSPLQKRLAVYHPAGGPHSIADITGARERAKDTISQCM